MKNLTQKEKGTPSVIRVTAPVKSERRAVEDKMKSINPKLFGLFNPLPYTLKGKRKVYLPYGLMIFSFSIRSGKNPDSSRLKAFDRHGEIGIIFDFNEVHGFHFDLSESLSLKSVSQSAMNGVVLEDSCTEEEAVKKCRDLISRKYLNRPFKNTEIRLVSIQRFYREAWELTVDARGNQFEKYAYLDIYGSSNEHISGLKLRLNI